MSSSRLFENPQKNPDPVKKNPRRIHSGHLKDNPNALFTSTDPLPPVPSHNSTTDYSKPENHDWVNVMLH